MKRILKISMDVHSTNYTLCAMEPTIGAEDRIYGEIQVAPDYKEVLRFIDSLKMKLGLDNEYSIECGYEAGCLGYSLYHQLTEAGVKCVILARSNVSYLLLRQCLPSRGSGSKQTDVTLI